MPKMPLAPNSAPRTFCVIATAETTATASSSSNAATHEIPRRSWADAMNSALSRSGGEGLNE